MLALVLVCVFPAAAGASEEAEAELLSAEETIDDIELAAPQEVFLEEEPEPIAEEPPEAEIELPDESLSEMEASLPRERSGDWSQDLIEAAYSQLGYHAREDGYSRYADWCGRYAADWCYNCSAEWNRGEVWASWRDSWDIDACAPWDAAFVTFCLFYAGIPIEQMPPAVSAEYWAALLDIAGVPFEAASDYTPAPGDLIFFDWDEENNEYVYDEWGELTEIIPVADHVGIVTYVAEDGRLWYAAGDMDASVQERHTWLGDGTIIGYAVLPEEPSAAEDEELLTDEAVEEATEEPSAEVVTAEESIADGPDFGPVLDGEAERYTMDPYSLAPAGYELLRVRDDLGDSMVYTLDGVTLYYTDDQAYLIESEDAGVFLALVPTGTEIDLTAAEGERRRLEYSCDINGDGVINIADANAVYQMAQQGGNYYGTDQVSLEARLRLLYRDISDLNAIVNTINGY